MTAECNPTFRDPRTTNNIETIKFVPANRKSVIYYTTKIQLKK